MYKYLVVVTDYDYPDLNIERKILSRINAEMKEYQCLEENDVIRCVKKANVIINQYAPITRKVIDSLDDTCYAIGQYGIGVDTIDVKAATEKGIVVINVPSYCEDEVAEHVLAMLMALARKILSYNNDVKHSIWDWKTQVPIYKLSNKTLGLIGFGKIAKKLVEKVKGFSFHIIAYDPYIDVSIMNKLGVRKVSLERLLIDSDFISIHVLLVEETKNLLSDEEFLLMKREAIIINASRGPVIDQEALYRALSSGKIAAAGLDVLYNEPPTDIHCGKKLFSLNNICLTPHVAWYSEESTIDLRTKLSMDIVRVLQGIKPEGFVNPNVKTHLIFK